MKYLNTKPGSIEEVAAKMSKYAAESEYQDMFKKELEKAGKGIGSMTPAEKKAFFNKIDSKYTAKDEAVKEPYAVGMAAAMKQTGDKPPLKKSTITKAHDIAKSIEKDQKEEVSQKEIDKFHTSLDKLVHKSFGHSSDEKKKEVKKEEKDVPKGYHKMPDGKIMKDSEHKKEEVKETHSFVTNKQNQKQKDTGGEKDIVDPAPEMRKESLQDAIKSVWQMSAEQLEKIKSEAKYYKKESDTKKKDKTDIGTTATPVDTTPNVDYTN